MLAPADYVFYIMVNWQQQGNELKSLFLKANNNITATKKCVIRLCKSPLRHDKNVRRQPGYIDDVISIIQAYDEPPIGVPYWFW